MTTGSVTTAVEMRAAGWWRRNRWGLVLLIPALAAALVSPGREAYDEYWAGQPHRAVSAAPGGWAALHGTRMRLTGLSVQSGLKDFVGDPVQIPDGTRVWLAKLDVETTSTKGLTGCEAYLEAGDGRTFDADPPELLAADLPFGSCTPNDTDSKATAYRTEAYFLLPSDADPVALRIVVQSWLPDYLRLTPP